MSSKPRISAAGSGQVPNFASVMQHTPAATAAFFDLYAQFWQHGEVAADVKEMTRLRNARITDCGY